MKNTFAKMVLKMFSVLRNIVPVHQSTHTTGGFFYLLTSALTLKTKTHKLKF